MKKIKASFVKKAGVVVLSCVLLCGQGLSAAAASSAAIQRESGHEHLYRIPEWQLIGFAPYRHHEYIDSVGRPQTCAVWQYVYSGEAVCVCGDSLGSQTKTEYVHLNCGR